MVSGNVVVLAGRVAAEAVSRALPSGDQVTELGLSVPEAGQRLLPLPVVAWHKSVPEHSLRNIGKDVQVLVYGQLARRFY